MSNAWFFEKFELIADLPDAVSRMRELVLELAMKGCLLESPCKSKWLVVRLDQLGKWAQGSGFPTTEQGHSGREILFSKVSDMNLPGNEIEILATANTIHRQTAERLKIKIHPAGTVIFPKIGGAIATNKRRILTRPTAIDNNCSGIIPNENCSTDWLYLVLRTIDFSNYQTGTSVPAVNQSTLGQIQLPLPPLSEQRRIVAKVEELMGICDRLELEQRERESSQRVIVRSSLQRFSEEASVENLGYLFHGSYTVSPSDLRKTILTLAVQGKLVPQDPAEGDSLVGTHFTFLNGYAFKSEWFKSGGTRLCRNVNIRHGTLDWKDIAFVDEKTTIEFSRFMLSENDLVLALDRPIISTGLKVAKVRKQDTPCLLLQRVAKPVPKHDQIDLNYFFLWLNSPSFIDAIDPGRSNGVPHISTRQIEQIPMTLPSLETQRRIVAKVEELMSMVDELEEMEKQATDRGSSLLDAIVHELAATVG